MKSGWKAHKGKKYFYCDYRDFGMDLDGLKAEVNYADGQICRNPEGSVRAMTDVRGTVGTPEIVEFFKRSAIKTKPYIFRQAVLGLEGIRKLLAMTVSRFSGQAFKAFDDEETAKEWLAED